ncbi:SGNH/GDSL hydrolase family protein [Pelagibius sp. CAU 1746]|uniref:SGNH/GDSL hydrolase family protein n=1 Tax=Pelagibius sp. CAU 1746 TaxID=3140370 RepID=UPI00325BA801
MRLLFLVLLAFLLAGAAQAVTPSYHQTIAIRIAQMEAQAQVVRSGDPAAEINLFLGDSITEGLWGQPHCQMPAGTINGGIGSMTVRPILDRIDEILDRVQPDEVTIMLGVNDAARSRAGSTETANWEADYTALVNAIRARGIRVALFLVMPVEAGKPMGDAYFDPRSILRFNRHILYAVDADLIVNLYHPWLRAGTLVGLPGMTVDGVHLTRAYARAYCERIKLSFSSLL